jgi:hypothetical protein
MHTMLTSTPRWSTTSFGDTTETSPAELSELGDHLTACRAASGRLGAVRCGIEAAHGFVSARFVTTLFVFAVLIGIALLAL